MKSDRERIRDYYAALPPDTRRGLRAIRDAIRSAAPRAKETFGYGMPAFALDGETVLWYAAWKQHYSIYPISAATVRAVGAASGELEVVKGTIRFPLENPPSAAFVKRLVRARLAGR